MLGFFYLKVMIWLIILHTLFSLFISFKLNKRNKLSIGQKRINIILTWIIPFLYGLIALELSKNRKWETHTKSKRKKKFNVPPPGEVPGV